VLILRPAAARDLDALLELAGLLDSFNLPRDPEFLTERIALSERSFAAVYGGPPLPWQEAVYMFVMEDPARQHVVGSSLILAKHGRPGAPYFWAEVSIEERHSPQLGKRFSHKKLRLRSTTDGPTEIGGLILDPAYRHHPHKCGKALSIVRFAFISAHAEHFEKQVIAEMLSRFDAPGKNLLWDAFGAKFTDLPYREADHLSARTKQFIADLFPQDPVYVTLFPEDVQKMIGQPNDTAKPAVRILEKIGFHPLNQVDPFDGGPYYGAARDAIVSVRERRELVLPGEPTAAEVAMADTLALLSTEKDARFRATVVPLDDEGQPVASAEIRDVLGVASGDRVCVTPLP
jgi:arginine N-succinyltransferase